MTLTKAMIKITSLCVSTTLISAISIKSAAQIQIYDDFSDFSFGAWAGQGDVNQTQSGCVAYLIFGFIPVAMDYQLRVRMNSPAPNPGSPFRFYNDANSAYYFPFYVSVSDLHAGGSPRSLSPNNYPSAGTLTYSPSCSGGNGPNAELNFSILAADMYQVPAGDYTVSTDVQVRRLSNGSPTTETATQTNLRGTISIPSLVMITNMDDINLTYDGVSPNMTYNETYCVYANTNNFQLTVSSTTAGVTAGSYAVRDSGGNNPIDYTVRVSNTLDASGGTTVQNGGSTSFTNPANSNAPPNPYRRDCNSSDNAAVYLEFGSAALQAVPAGSYSGTLQLMVAPL